MCKVVGVAEKVSGVCASDLSRNSMLMTSGYLKTFLKQS